MSNGISEISNAQACPPSLPGIDVWASIICDYLDDYDVVALNGTSKQLRVFFDNPKIYTRRLWRRWKLFDVDVFAFDMSCMPRDQYIKVCHQFDNWKKEIKLIGAPSIKLVSGNVVLSKLFSSSRSDARYVRFKCAAKFARSMCWSCNVRDMYGCAHYDTTVSVEKIPDMVPDKWFDPLYDNYIQMFHSHEYQNMLEYERCTLQYTFRHYRNRRRPSPYKFPRGLVVRRRGSFNFNTFSAHLRRLFITRNTIPTINAKISLQLRDPSTFNTISERLAQRYMRMKYWERNGKMIVYGGLANSQNGKRKITTHSQES